MKHIYNLIVAGAYFCLLLQLVGFMINPKVLIIYIFNSLSRQFRFYLFHIIFRSSLSLKNDLIVQKLNIYFVWFSCQQLF